MFYLVWHTGYSFTFSECELWPNYNSLARSFAKGQLELDQRGQEDYSLVNGKAYLYSGPVPALIRLPVTLYRPEGIPTGFMIACFTTGTVIIFYFLMGILIEETHPRSDDFVRAGFLLFMIFNGITLFINLVPSFHHEAISSGMFFLISSVYLLFKIQSQGFKASFHTAFFLGISIVLCLGSRLSFAPSVAFLLLVTAIGIFRSTTEKSGNAPLVTAATVFGVVCLGAVLLLAYNYARYGSPFETGMQYQASHVFGAYFRQGNYFRYDHIPYNLWSYFFRLPILSGDFPFIIFPVYIIKSETLQYLPYYLINANELVISIFFLMPVLLFAFYPCLMRFIGHQVFQTTAYTVLMILVVLQTIPVSATVAATARYYYDFFPILSLAAFLGAVQFGRRGPLQVVLVVSAVLASTVFSLALPVNGIAFYHHLIGYSSPMGLMLGILK